MPSHSGVEHDLFEAPPPPPGEHPPEASDAAVDLSDIALSERPPRNDSAPPLFDLAHNGPAKPAGVQEDIDFLLGLQGSRGTTATLQNPTLADLAKKPPSEPPPFPIDVEFPVAQAEPAPVAVKPRTSTAAEAFAPPPPAQHSAAPHVTSVSASPQLKSRKRPAALFAVAALGLSGAVLASTMLTHRADVAPPAALPTVSPEPPPTSARATRSGSFDSDEPASPPLEIPASGETSTPRAPSARAQAANPRVPSRPATTGTKPPLAEKTTPPSTTIARNEPATPTPARVEPARPTPPITPRPSEPRAPVGAGFDRQAAVNALNTQAGQASSCRKGEDPSGTATVVITFAPSGRVTSANVSGPPFAGTPTGGCIAAAFRRARVPEFDGDNITVSKTVVIH
ncbi:MAG TPA: hypothetical protein VFQ35_26955 [Polyangiaceae bacterium]|nr:hypothetical protein [Polyangiaceae bacterium]